ncbi:rhodanese-like domain-containing protein [Bacteroidota bacterium]
MKLNKLFYLLLVLPMLFVYTGCSSDDSSTNNVEDVNEALVLAQYLEISGDFINTSAPAMITAEAVRTTQLAGGSQHIIDIRSAADYANGHIEGAVNVAAADIITYMASIDAASYETIVVACYSGQTAGWVTGILRCLGYNNVKDLKWGMCSWNQTTSGSWTSNVSNTYATDFVTTTAPKNAAGDYPTLSTGLTTGADILANRATAVIAEGFSAAAIAASSVFTNLDNYYIVNYWSEAHYTEGHIDGAIQYTPKADLKTTTFLNTLPTDETIVVYCYTGQTSAHVAGYLRMLGYDAKSLKFGVNAMAYDWMTNLGMTHFDQSYIADYPLVTD